MNSWCESWIRRERISSYIVCVDDLHSWSFLRVVEKKSEPMRATSPFGVQLSLIPLIAYAFFYQLTTLTTLTMASYLILIMNDTNDIALTEFSKTNTYYVHVMKWICSTGSLFVCRTGVT